MDFEIFPIEGHRVRIQWHITKAFLIHNDYQNNAFTVMMRSITEKSL